MTTQRITGIWIVFFIGCVVLNHFVQGDISSFDAIYGAFCVPLMASIFVDRPWARLAQVSVIIATGAIMVVTGDYSQPFGFIIMVIGQLYLYRYELLRKYLYQKVVLLTLGYGILFIVTLDTIGNAILWLMMAITCQGGVWLPVWDLIMENRRAEEIKNRELEKALIEKEALLEETVEAGVVLVKELKTKESENDCKG